VDTTKAIEFLVFNREQASDLVINVGLGINAKGYVTKDGVAIKCECCGRMVKPDQVGNIVPGSTKVYCDNPSCFAEYVDKYLWE